MYLALATEHADILREDAKLLEKPEEKFKQIVERYENVLVIERENVKVAMNECQIYSNFTLFAAFFKSAVKSKLNIAPPVVCDN